MVDTAVISSSGNLVGIVQVLALFSTYGFFISGSATCLKIHRQKSVKNVNFLPYLMALVNGFLWCVYGLLKNDALLIFVNGSGCVFQSVYIFIFIQNCESKMKCYCAYKVCTITLHLRWKLIGITRIGCEQLYLKQLTVVLLPAMLVTSFLKYKSDTYNAVDILGWIACIVTVVMFGSPLSTIKTVVQTRNSETISLPLSLMTVIVSGSWFAYGVLIQDLFVQGPNILGVILGLFQIYLHNRYRAVNSKIPI